jgi:hypothetical protein
MTLTERPDIRQLCRILQTLTCRKVHIPCHYLQIGHRSHNSKACQADTLEPTRQLWVSLRRERRGIIDVTRFDNAFPNFVSSFETSQINVEPPSRQSPGSKGHPSTARRGPSTSIIPADIPLPETRPRTMYEGGSGHPHPRQSITAIDFAQRYPLPDSRPTTIMERHSGGGERHLAATVEVSEVPATSYQVLMLITTSSSAHQDVLDVEAPIIGRSAPLPSILKRDRGLSPMPPGSVRPSRRKTSSEPRTISYMI